MSNYHSNHLRYLGVLSCRRGGFPPLFLLKDWHNLASKSIASCSHSTFLYLKCVTLINRLRFLWAEILERIDVLLLPIYTTVPLNNNSYAPGSSGAFLAVLSLKGYNLFASGISCLLSFRPLYTPFVIDGNHLLMLPLAKRLGVAYGKSKYQEGIQSSGGHN